jgi:hypothetical protein
VPAWITTYLHRPPPELTAEAIQQGISQADLLTLGEDFMERDDVEAFLAQLRWSDEPLEFSVEPERRPVQLYVWNDPSRVATELSEIAERGPVPQSVQQQLSSVTGVIAIELGWSQLQTMYEVVAFEIAYWLVEQFGGVILSSDDLWYDAGEHRWEPMTE